MRGKESGVSQECEQEIPYLLLTHFPNACNGQGWTGQAGSQVAGTQTSQGLHQQEAEGRSQSWAGNLDASGDTSKLMPPCP